MDEAQRVTHVRRNGKLLSCEPCRKSKLRCNHELPSCGRCQRRGIPSQCIYHPAPMTRQRTEQSASPPPSAGQKRTMQDIGLEPSPNDRHDRPWRTRFPPTPSQTDSLETPTSPVQAAPITLPGFLGPTSYSAVFTENENNFEIDSDGNASAEFALGGLPRMKSDQIEQGAQALALFSNYSLYERLIERWYSISQNLSMIEFMIRTVRQSVIPIRDASLKKPNNRHLRTISERISRKSMTPMQVPPGCPLDRFLSLWTGDSLRWEAIGLYFTLVGLGSTTVQDSDHVDRELKHMTLSDGTRRKLDKKQLANQMISAAEMCVAFSDLAGNPNDLTVWLLHELTILISIAHGDDNYQVWKKMGDLTTAVFALGLHEGIEANDKVPFYLAELRKREFCHAYNVDKLLSTFLGRPPRITRRYCKFQLPSYLSDEEIVGSEEVRQLALSKLDANGWSTDGTFRRVLWARVWMLGSMIREQILEVYLGADVDDEDVHKRVEEINQYIKATWASMPAFLDYDPNVWRSGIPYSHCFTLLVVRFDRLYSDLLLQRALIKRTGGRSRTLLSISRQLLMAVLTLGAERDRIVEYSCDFPWLISFYGLPSAGILAIELLKQTQHPSSIPADPDQESFSRSETIQHLSVFISFLESMIRPGDGNYLLCDRARKALKHTLDRVLSPPPMPIFQPPSTPVNHSQDVSAGAGLSNNFFSDFPQEDGFDFLNWIDTMDWDKGPWVNTMNAIPL